MEAEQQTPSNITNKCLNLLKKLQQIEVEVVHFTNLPADTPRLDRFAEFIQKKFVFLRKLLTAEITSYGLTPTDLSDIEGKLAELEAEFYRCNQNSVIVHDNDGSESSSVCEDCLNNAGELPKRESESEESVYEVPEMIYEIAVPPPSETTMMLPSGPEEDKEALRPEESGGGGKRGRRWWCNMMAVLMTVSGVLTVSLSGYFDYDQHQGFLTPT